MAQLEDKYRAELTKVHSLHNAVKEEVTLKGLKKLYSVQSAGPSTQEINKDYLSLIDDVKLLQGTLSTKMKWDESKFMEMFKEKLRKLHTRYRQLEKQNMELMSHERLE